MAFDDASRFIGNKATMGYQPISKDIRQGIAVGPLSRARAPVAARLRRRGRTS
jgi:hypothetical protein